MAFSTELRPLPLNMKNKAIMITDITYKFESHIQANRFINELQHWEKHSVKAKLFAKSNMVKVSYEFDERGFDYTCSDLDDIASIHNGTEC